MLKGQEQFQRSGRRIANLGYIVSVVVAGVTEEDTAPKPDERERKLGREGEIDSVSNVCLSGNILVHCVGAAQ